MAEEKDTQVRIRPNLENYVDGVSGSGKKTKNCGDPVAEALDGFTVDEVRSVASKFLEVPVKDLTEKYAHLNVGQQVMNLRNRIRGEVNKRDKAHEQDKAVVPGLKALTEYCAKPREAVTKRREEAAAKRKEREAKAAAKAKEAKENKAPAKGGKKAA